jgi:hypothetical protein
MPTFPYIFISIYRPTQATFETFGGLLMGAIFLTAPLSSLGAVDGGRRS